MYLLYIHKRKTKSFQAFDSDVSQETSCHSLDKPDSLNSILGVHVKVEGEN